MFLQQADLLQDTRSLLINSSIMQISQDNDELKQSVRIADNELKIIMLTDQVHRIKVRKWYSFKNSSTNFFWQVSALQDRFERYHVMDKNDSFGNEIDVQEIGDKMDGVIEVMPKIKTYAKDVMDEIQKLPQVSTDRGETKPIIK